MKTKLKNKIALLFLVVILVSGQITAFGAGERTGTYAKTATPATATPSQLNGNGVLRAGGTENEGDGGNSLKLEALEDDPASLSDGLFLLVLAGLGYGLFVWRKEQRKNLDMTRHYDRLFS
jgi:hypothetical protein